MVIRPRHMRSMLRRELGVFVTNKLGRHAKGFMLKKFKKQFIEDGRRVFTSTTFLF